MTDSESPVGETVQQESVAAEKEVPRTDRCEECEREIVPELEYLTGKHELIHQARQSEEGFMPVIGGKATVVFRCQCSTARVEYGPGSASAWDIPDSWLWEDDVDA